MEKHGLTPEEKAKDLVDKFEKYSDDVFQLKREGAVKCAIICVDEILQTNPTIKGNSEDIIIMIVQTKAYWTQVRSCLIDGNPSSIKLAENVVALCECKDRETSYRDANLVLRCWHCDKPTGAL